MMTLTITGNPVTKKNHSQIVMIKGYPRLLPSKTYTAYRKVFLKQITGDKRVRLDLPCTLKVVYYMETRRKVDLCNLLAATCDLLVEAGVIADDNCQIVASHDGSRVLYDKDNPRAEIEITPVARSLQEDEI